MTEIANETLAHPRTSAWRDAIVAGTAIVLGLSLITSAQSFPSGVGLLPGPGFFPMMLGVFIVLLGCAIAVESRTRRRFQSSVSVVSNRILPLASIALVFGYLISWGWIPFLVRTPLLLLGLMRSSGASWRQSLLSAVALSLLLYLVFQLGLRVSLD